MKKIISFTISILFCFESFAIADYNGYKTYLKGLLELKKGNIESAIVNYEKTLAYDSNATTVYKDLAIIYMQKGNINKALENANKLRELEKDSVNMQMFLGNFYLSANDMITAKQCWERVLEIDPQNETATVYLAAYYYSDNKLKESLDYWTKFLEQEPESSEGYLQLGLIQEKLDMQNEALESYKKVNELNPNAQEGYLARARIYESKKEYELAINEYKEYSKLFTGNPSILIYLGKCYFEEKRYKEAEEVLLRAKELTPNNISLNYLLGMSYEKQKKIDEAIEIFEFIIKQEPIASNYTRLGFYYALKQDYKTAEKQFNKALELEPLNSEILYLAGLNYIDYKKFEQAKKSFEQSLFFVPDNIDAKFYLAVSNDRLKDFNKAEELFKEILETDPENVKTLNYLGYSYVDRNINLDEAEKMLTKVVELSPNIPAHLDSLGWLYYKKQNYELAEKYLLEAVNVQPKFYDKDMYEHLGDVSVELNKIPQAYLSYAISYDIGSKSAGKKLKLIEKKLDDKDLYKVLAERAVINFDKINSLKLGYKLKIKEKTVVNTYVTVYYAQQCGVKFEMAPKFSFQGGSIFFKDGNVEFNPQAMKKNISPEFVSMFDFAKIVFSNKFLVALLSSEFSKKGSLVTYKNKDYTMIIDVKTGSFKEISKKDTFKLKIKSNQKFESIASKIPSSLLFESKTNNLKCSCELNIMSGLTPNDLIKFSGNENDNN